MMIVTPDDKASKQSSDVKGPMEGPQDGPEEPPPSYSPPVASGSSSSPNSLTFKTKPTNFLVLYNDNDDIKGQFVIDPSMSIPPSMLPPLGEGETDADRKNLSLKSKSGSVRAEIWLLGPQREGATKSGRATIALASNHGSINAQVQTLDGAGPFLLTANSPHGSIRLAVPRSFQGLLSVSTLHGSICLSDTILENATQLSQLENMRRYFIGDFNLFGEGEWQGDQMELDSTHGSIHMKYGDEVMAARGKKGLFSRLFG